MTAINETRLTSALENAAADSIPDDFVIERRKGERRAALSHETVLRLIEAAEERDRLRVALDRLRTDLMIKRDIACEENDEVGANRWGFILARVDRALNGDRS